LAHVGDIRGRGLFIGIEFVANKKTKEPFEAKYAFAGKVHARTLELGVATYPGQGTADGWKGDHILLAPPFTITEEECDVIVEVLERVLCELS
jgi:adenosylmethionine-8-amino-7-oxononanoate aminotransferase